MTFLQIIYTILIMPLQLLFEVVFSFAERFTKNPGLSIVVLSLVMNFLVLPLYKRADALQEKQRNKEMKMRKGIQHIKKVYSGDEQMMILQTYYRQNDYKPADILLESLSLLIQIPFFIAAYRFLSDIAVLNGASFGPIRDLGAPDGILAVGSVSINLLPVLMTVINILSAMIYTRGLPVKSKIQLYVMALFFLVFLYSSPSGLVFYWTLNNLFSLLKNIFMKLKDPDRVLRFLFSFIGAAMALWSIFVYDNSFKRRMIVVALGILFQVPLLVKIVKGSTIEKSNAVAYKTDKRVFFISSLFLAILIGGMIPSSVIKASPQEFVDITAIQSPIWYIVYSFCVAVGVFAWIGVFYKIAENKVKCIIELFSVLFAFAGLIDYLFFATDLGVLSANLKYERFFVFSVVDIVKNAVVLIGLVVLLIIMFYKFRTPLIGIMVTVVIAISIMSAVNMIEIKKSVNALDVSEKREGSVDLTLSKTGKNVIVLMLDRAMGTYIPYLVNERPDLKEKLDGFTWYSNVISYGLFTNFGTPAIFGGYEYTPVEMNKRDKESLKSKQNEALKVMPVLFDENDYDVTVCDVPYANYIWIPDLSIYSDYPNIKTFNTEGLFDTDTNKITISNRGRTFFMYGVMKTMPLFMQKYVYNAGHYNYVRKTNDRSVEQFSEGISRACGYDESFMSCYEVLRNLADITSFNGKTNGSFLMMNNNTTHNPMILQEPEFEPYEEVDNTGYDNLNKDRFSLNGHDMKMEKPEHYAHYETNMAVLIKLGEWFDYLRQNGVYNNTRIILVSDHGRALDQFEELKVNTEEKEYDIEGCACLLMVKDFDAHGFMTDDTFMTNGDVPSLAFSGLIENPINPFTGKEINSEEKNSHDQYVLFSNIYDINVNNGNQYLPGDWLAVKDDMWNKDNWRIVKRDSVYVGE